MVPQQNQQTYPYPNHQPNPQIKPVRQIKHECLCGVNVHSATKVIVFLNMIFIALGIVQYFFNDTKTTEIIDHRDRSKNSQKEETLHSPYFLPTSIVAFILNLSVLYGLKNKQPNYYVPYLAVTSFFVIFVGLVGLLIGLDFIQVNLIDPRHENRIFYKDHGLEFEQFLLGVGIYVIYVYFYFVVINRSHNLLKFELSQNSNQTHPNVQFVPNTHFSRNNQVPRNYYGAPNTQFPSNHYVVTNHSAPNTQVPQNVPQNSQTVPSAPVNPEERPKSHLQAPEPYHQPEQTRF